jgi:DNA-binding NarL/FixJ family response regulator
MNFPGVGRVTRRLSRAAAAYPLASAMTDQQAAPPPQPGDPAVIRVLIVEDHQMFAEALARALQDERDISIAGICRNLESARDWLRREQADVVLMDYSMPDGDGIAMAGYIRREHPQTRVMVVSAAEERSVLLLALEAGCSGFVGKSESMSHLPSAIRGAMVGNVAISPGMATKLVGPEVRSHVPGEPLTARELQVLRLVAQGRSTQQIAEHLFMSEMTVRNKISRINAKLGTHSKLEAATRALRLGLADLDPGDESGGPRFAVVPRPSA